MLGRNLDPHTVWSDDGSARARSTPDRDTSLLPGVFGDTITASGRSAAWLAHQTGGLGVASSNLAVPTTRTAAVHQGPPLDLRTLLAG